MFTMYVYINCWFSMIINFGGSRVPLAEQTWSNFYCSMTTLIRREMRSGWCLI